MRHARTIHAVRPQHPPGTVTVELALALPVLIFVFFVGADFSRAFYYSQVLTESAYRGAQFASNADLAARLPFSTVDEAVLVDLQNLKPTPTVQTTPFDDPVLPTVQVTVSYEFRPIMQKFGLVTSMTLTRSVRMRLHPSSDLPTDGEL